MAFFVEQVRVMSATLDTVVKNTGSWEHFWKQIPQENHGGHSVPKSDDIQSRSDIPPEVQQEMKRLRNEAKSLQVANDRLRSDMDFVNNNVNVPKGKDKGKGKGKGKGKADRPAGNHERRADRERSPRGRDRDRR